MVRAMACLLVLALPFAPAWADGARPTEAQTLYAGLAASMDDTAAAHVQMARWCTAAGMAERAAFHWKEALVHDAANAEARAALTAGAAPAPEAQPPAPAAPAAPQPVITGPTTLPEGSDFLARRAEFRRNVTVIARDLLPSTNYATVEAGRRTILDMTDPAAVEPIATILAKGNVGARKLAVEALSKIPGDESTRYLTRYSLKDPSDEVRIAAAAALKDRDAKQAVPQLVAALKSTGPTRDHAAMALAELGDRRAIPALISRLNRTEQRIFEAPVAHSGPVVGTGVYIAVGTVTTYVADLQPIVSEAAVGWDPTVGAITTGGVLDVRNVSVTMYRTIYNIQVPRPAVREALMRLTGQDFGFDTAQWNDWYLSTGRAGR